MVDYFDDNELLKLFASDPEEHEGGPSELFAALGCAKKVSLINERCKQEGEAFDVLGKRAFKRNVGSTCHKLVELYHDGVDDVWTFFPEHSEHPEIDGILQRAWPLFSAYREQFPRGFWGKCLGTEVKLPGGGRVDALFEVDADASERIFERLGEHVRPGIMVWDLKTSFQKDNQLHEKYEWSLAGTMYLDRTEEALGQRPSCFFIFHAVVYAPKSKLWAEGKWASAAAFDAEDMLGADARERLANAMKFAEENKTSGRANIARCNDWGQCAFKSDGTCKGW